VYTGLTRCRRPLHSWSSRLALQLNLARAHRTAVNAKMTHARDVAVILTFSGKSLVASSGEIWSRVAHVMKMAGANIETCGGTFAQMPTDDDDSLETSSFSVSAYGANISSSLPIVNNQGQQQLLGCTMYFKAVLPESGIEKMMKLLRQQSPLQVYTVSLGTFSGPRGASQGSKLLPGKKDPNHYNSLENVGATQQTGCQTGTVYLFGIDRPGQLAAITEVLSKFDTTILHLRVQVGIADPEKCDFVLAHGGTLAENRIKIGFAERTMDEALLRCELQRVASAVGYAVTGLTIDRESQLRATLPSYLFRRKAFVVAFLDTVGRNHMQRRTCKTAHPSKSRIKATAVGRRGSRHFRSS